jgi:hypothetical protein
MENGQNVKPRIATEAERDRLALLQRELSLAKARWDYACAEIFAACAAPPTHTALNFKTGEWLEPQQPRSN